MRACVRLLLATLAASVARASAEPLPLREPAAEAAMRPEAAEAQEAASPALTAAATPAHTRAPHSPLPSATPSAHCADFLGHCVQNVATASCVFTRSVVFQCGAQASLPSSSQANNSTSTNSSSSNSDDHASTSVDDALAALDALTCHWNLAGDLSLAPGVVIQVAGDECLLELSVGKMLLLQQDAQLLATAISVDASSVRVEANARVAAAFYGAYRNHSGLFTGSSQFGASSGGSGGQRVTQQDSALQATLGFFDAREHTADAALSAPQRRALLDAASASYDLAQLWDIAAQSPAQHRSITAVRLLLGSPSVGGDARNATAPSVLIAGGGRIRISASKDLVLMAGAAITANGEDALDGVAGGAGGSVFVEASALSVAGQIEARGGDARCSTAKTVATSSSSSDSDDNGHVCAPAGGGGRIHVSYLSSQLDDRAIDASGGQLVLDAKHKPTLSSAARQALAGAAGMYYCVVRRADGTQATRLVISNLVTRDGIAPLGGAVTSVAVYNTSAHDDDDERSVAALDAVVITDGAAVATHSLRLPHGDLDVANSSVLLESVILNAPVDAKTDTVAIAAKDVLVSSQSRVVLFRAPLTLAARAVAMDATTSLQFTASVRIAARETLVLDANVTSTQSLGGAPTSGKTDRSTQFLVLTSGGSTILGGAIAVGGVGVASRGSINVTGTLAATHSASAKSTFLPCDEQPRDVDTRFDAATSTIANFTMVLNAHKSIAFGQTDRPAVVRAAAVLVCAKDTIALTPESRVSANGLGELANQGAGSGNCVGSVGGGGGYGGRGADSSAVNDVGDYASGGLTYGTRSGVGLLGSGGGCVDGGSGGGVVMLGARGLVLNGEIHCNGANGVNGAGGGSGGFLGLLVTDFLRGHGRISAVGGSSACAGAIVTMVSDVNGTPPIDASTTPLLSANATEPVETAAPMTTSHVVPRLCGGGGGGGRLQLTGCGQSDFDKCTSGFDGNYTVAGGTSTLQLTGDGGVRVDKDTSAVVAAAASGTFFGFPCAPGSGGLFCRPCKPGLFKSESNSEECQPCRNAPSNAHYAGYGSITADCDWTCDPGYSGDHCVSPLEQLLDACGGEIGFVLVLLSIAIGSILLGYACRNRKEPSYARMYTHGGAKGERQHLLSSAVASSQRSRWAFLCRCFYWPRVKYEKLATEDLPEHMARLYFAGRNDRDSPLKLRQTVPESLRAVLDDYEFSVLAQRINAALAWKTGLLASWGEFVYKVVALVCYPFASEVLVYRRHLRINALKRIIGTYNHACMKGPRAKALQDAIKVGYSPDYSLVYLELVNKESATSVCVPTTRIGRPSLPLVLLFAGSGTYYAPFYLDPSDLLVRSVPQCPELTAFIDEPWIMFVAELNALLRVVSRDEACLVETLLPVAKFLERKMAVPGGGNGILGGLRIYLGRFYVQDDAECGEEFKLGLLLTNGNESLEAQQPPLHLGNGGGSRYNKPAKDMSGYGYNSNSYSRGLDTLEPPGGRGKTGSFGNADGLHYDTPGWSTAAGGGLNARGAGNRRGSIGNAAAPSGAGPKGIVSSIREEALRIRSSTAGSVDAGPGAVRRGGGDELHALAGPKRSLARRRRTFYEGWLGPVDASMPVPGVLISADELEDRLIDRPRSQRIESFIRLHVLPKNVRRSSWLNHAWMLNTALLSLLMLDLAITFAMVVNLKCVTDGEVDHDCSASVMVPVLLVPPLTLVTSPIIGIVTLALNSSTFSRRYSVWNSLSMVNVAIALCAGYVQSSRLVAPWFAGPLPLLPVIALVIKAAQSFVIERYVAYQETYKRRRGWRGLMKRRLSDASIPAESP